MDKNGLFKNLFSKIEYGTPIDLNRYTDLEDMYGYIGFIDKEGGFYRVRKIGSMDCGHGEWAYYFLDSIKKETGISPELKLYKNIHILLDEPKFEMAFLYEDDDSSKKENSKINYSSSVGEIDMPMKQKEVIKHLIEHQNNKSAYRERNKDDVKTM